MLAIGQRFAGIDPTIGTVEASGQTLVSETEPIAKQER